MDLYIIVYLLSNIFLAHIINKFMYLFYEKCRVNKYIEFCVYSAYFVLITFVFLYFGNAVVTISFNICSIFVFTLMYDYISLKKSIVITFIIYLILCLIDLSVLAIVNFNSGTNVYIMSEYSSILALLVNSIIYLIISFFIYFKKYNFKKIEFIFKNKNHIFLGFILFISISFILFNFVTNNNIFYVIILNLFVLGLNIIIFKYYDLISKNIYERILNKILNEKIDGYKRQIQIFEQRIHFKKYVNSNNHVINGILNSKIDNLDKEVKLNFNIFVNEDLKINIDDLLIIIGNLMDNAISGVNSTLKDRDKYIDIKIKYIKGTIIVNIKNSFNEKTLYKRKKIFNSKNKFTNYGLGLLTVKEIVEKYKGVLEVKFNKNNFETYVLIYI